MADWPRSIQPEDRVKYLIQARADLRANDIEGTITGEDGNWAVHHNELLIGEFDTKKEAYKALFDHVVLASAVAQAWEDVAS